MISIFLEKHFHWGAKFPISFLQPPTSDGRVRRTCCLCSNTIQWNPQFSLHWSVEARRQENNKGPPTDAKLWISNIYQKLFINIFCLFVFRQKFSFFWIPCIIYFSNVLFHHINKKKKKSWKTERKCFVTDGFAEFQWERTFYRRRLAKVKHIRWPWTC